MVPRARTFCVKQSVHVPDPVGLPDPVTYPLQFAAPDLRTLPWNPAFMSRTPEPTHRLNNLCKMSRDAASSLSSVVLCDVTRLVLSVVRCDVARAAVSV